MQSKKLFKRILVPMDQSIDNTQQLSMFIAERFQSEVTILHVVSPRLANPEVKETFVALYGPTQFSIRLAREYKRAFKEGRKNVSNVAAQFKQKGITVQERIVENDDPAEAIIEEAENTDYELIIMAHSEAKEKNPHLGSVTEKVSQYSRTPVLIVRERDSISRILVPIDGSENAEKALEHATAIAREANAEITLLNVLDQSHFKIQDEEENKVARSYILSKSANEAEGIKLHQRLESGNPGKIITQMANMEDYDLIVMGRKGQGSRLRFLGSVSSHVIHYANRSVLVVPKYDAVEPLSPDETIKRLVNLHIGLIGSLGSYAREKNDEKSLLDIFEYQSEKHSKGLEKVEWRADEIARNMIRLNFQPFGMEAKYSGNNEKATITVTKCPLPEKYLQSLEFLRIYKVDEDEKFNLNKMFAAPDRISATWEWPPKKTEVCGTCRIVMPKLGEKLGFIWEHQITEDIPPQCVFNIEIKKH